MSSCSLQWLPLMLAATTALTLPHDYPATEPIALHNDELLRLLSEWTMQFLDKDQRLPKAESSHFRSISSTLGKQLNNIENKEISLINQHYSQPTILGDERRAKKRFIDKKSGPHEKIPFGIGVLSNVNKFFMDLRSNLGSSTSTPVPDIVEIQSKGVSAFHEPSFRSRVRYSPWRAVVASPLQVLPKTGDEDYSNLIGHLQPISSNWPGSDGHSSKHYSHSGLG